MFSRLIESAPHRQRKVGTTVVSLVVHSGLIAVAVWATANAAIAHDKSPVEQVTYVETRKAAPPPPPKQPPPPPPKAVTVAPPPKGFQTLPPPVDIPKVIPDIDLTKQVTNEADFSGKGVAGGVANGVAGGTGPVRPVAPDNTIYSVSQVEKQARQDPNSPVPQYPDVLRSARVKGEVAAQFVVDTAGRAVVGSFTVLRSTNDQFTAALRAVLPRMRFIPAEVGGRKVRQLVQQQFNFSVTP